MAFTQFPRPTIAPDGSRCLCTARTICIACTEYIPRRAPSLAARHTTVSLQSDAVALTPTASSARERRLARSRAYYAAHRERILANNKAYARAHYVPHPRQRSYHPSVQRHAPLSPTLVASALSGIPADWRTADDFPPGHYLWHCDQWGLIAQLPHRCSRCQRQFLTEELRNA